MTWRSLPWRPVVADVQVSAAFQVHLQLEEGKKGEGRGGMVGLSAHRITIWTWLPGSKKSRRRIVLDICGASKIGKEKRSSGYYG